MARVRRTQRVCGRFSAPDHDRLNDDYTVAAPPGGGPAAGVQSRRPANLIRCFARCELRANEWRAQSKLRRPPRNAKGRPEQKGQVANSPDVGGAAIFHRDHLLLASDVHLDVSARSALVRSRDRQCDGSHRYQHVLGVGPLRAIVRGLQRAARFHVRRRAGIAIVANGMQFGFLFTPKKLQPKFSVLNPFPGIKRLFFSVSRSCSWESSSPSCWPFS